MQRVEIHRDFSVPVDRAFGYLAEHEHLGPLFGARIERVRDGDTSRNGVGSVRRLKVGPLPWFEETVTAVVPDERIDYEITKGSPLRGHHGTMQFSTSPSGSHLHYVIEFGAAVPGVDRLVRAMLQRNISAGLAKVDENA